MSKTKESKDGWIRHRGGKCPVGDLIRVEVRMRGGDSGHERADGLRWNHIDSLGDIMAYRIYEPAQQVAHEPAVDIQNAQADEGDPLVWRDRIYELAAQQEEINKIYNRQSSEIAAERDSLIQRLEGEGFRLIDGPAETATHAEDMSDWRNWEAGDCIECVSHNHKWSDKAGIGGLYVLDEAPEHDENHSLHICVLGLYMNPADFKWHSRPSA